MTMAACSVPTAGAKLSRNSRNLAGGEAVGPGAGRVCKSIIAAHAECYLFCGNGRLHGVVPRGDPGYRFSVQLNAPRRRLPTLCRRAEWQNNRKGKQPA